MGWPVLLDQRLYVKDMAIDQTKVRIEHLEKNVIKSEKMKKETEVKSKNVEITSVIVEKYEKKDSKSDLAKEGHENINVVKSQTSKISEPLKKHNRAWTIYWHH